MNNQSLSAFKPLRKPPIEISSLAKMPLAQLPNLPAEPGVYFAVDDANRVWYIGIGDSIRQRLSNHDRLPEFKENGVTAIAWKCEESPIRRRTLEKDLIEYCHPPLNVQHNFHSLPMLDLGLSPDEEIERFLRLRIQYKLIELELELLKPNIVTRCEQAAGDKILHRLGSISRLSYKRWQFSESVEQKKEALQLAQMEEKQNGSAIVKSITVSPIARLNASALVEEVAIWVSNIEKSQQVEELREAV